MLGDKFFDGGHHRAGQNDGEDRAGVGGSIYGNSQEVIGGASPNPSNKAGIDHQSANDHAQGHVGPKFLGGKGADQDGQEIESGVTGKAQQLIGRVVSRNMEHIQKDQNDLQHTAANEGGDHGGQGAGYSIEDGVHHALHTTGPLGATCVQILIHCGLLGKSRLFAHRVVYVSHSLTDDDLQLVPGPLGPKDAGELLDLFHLRKTTVFQIKAQPGDTVGQVENIVFPSHQFHHTGSQFIIILCHSKFSSQNNHLSPPERAFPGKNTNKKPPNKTAHSIPVRPSRVGGYARLYWR